jgi:cytochrome c556
MKRSVLAGVVALGLGGALTAAELLAQANPNLLINARKGAMTLQGKYFAPVLAMAQGRAPYDAKIVQRNADYLAVLSEMPWDDFQPHSLGLKNTRAKEDITMDQEKFRSLATQLQSEIRKLQAAARSGDQDAVKGTASTIARTCNNCHENFSTFDFRFKI